MKAVGHERYTQVDSGEWPTSQNRPIAVVAFEPDVFEERYGLKFAIDSDDLDSLRLAVVQLPSGNVVGLVRYDRSPEPGTMLFADEGSSPAQEQREFLEAFGLSEADLSWRLQD